MPRIERYGAFLYGLPGTTQPMKNALVVANALVLTTELVVGSELAVASELARVGLRSSPL
ncbi:hypothetical protein CXQ82_29105 [Pseudomonas sp. S09G 359]|nr:hypothetical protein CXQ82_29105 [Pseudomonas sp. S09G 359]